MTQVEINEAEWQDPSNWRLGCYSSPRDTRVWVPKPIRWAGWTVNLAHRAAYWWLAAMLVPCLVAAAVCIAISRG